MKKLLPFLIIMLLLAGCAEDAPANEPPSPPPVVTVSPFSGLSLSAEESCAMVSFMNAGRAALDGDTLYCFDFAEDYAPVLAAYTVGDTLSDRRVIASDCVPHCLTAADGLLYFIGDEGIERISPDGSGRELVHPCAAETLQYYNGAFYYHCGSTLYKYENGSERTVLEACCYPYVFCDMLLYQSEADGESLHIRTLDGEHDFKLSGLPSYAPLIVGDTVYFTQRGEAGMEIASAALTGGAVTVYDTPEFFGEAELYILRGELRARMMTDSGQLDAAFPFAEGELEQGRRYRRIELCTPGAVVDTLFEPGARILSFRYVTAEGQTDFMAGITEVPQ